MSRWRSKAASSPPPLVLGVSEQGVAWPASQEEGATLSWQSWTWPEGMPATAGMQEWVLHRSPSALPGQSLQVCLAPGLARHWVQPVPADTASLAELHAVASARARQLWGGAEPGGWMVSGDWQAQGHCLCNAVAAEWGAVWASLQDRWSAVALHTPLLLAQRRWQALWPQTGWLALAVARYLYILRREDGRMVSLRSLPWGTADTLQVLQAQAMQEARREMLRAGGGPEDLYWLPLAEGGDRVQAIPGLKPVPWQVDGTKLAMAWDAPEALQAAWCALQWGCGGGHEH